MCKPKATPRQIFGFNSTSGPGEKITEYTPGAWQGAYAPLVENGMIPEAHALSYGVKRAPGTFTTSEGRVLPAEQVLQSQIDDNVGQRYSTNAIVSTGSRGMNGDVKYVGSDFVGYDLSSSQDSTAERRAKEQSDAAAAAEAAHQAELDRIRTESQNRVTSLTNRASSSVPAYDPAAEQRKREEEERQRLAAEAARRQEQFAAGRSKLLEDTRNSVNQQFDPFNDDYFTKFATDFQAYYNPQIDDQYNSARNVLELRFADSGGVTNSGAQALLSELDTTRDSKREEIRTNAQAEADAFRSTVYGNRDNILGSITGGPETLADGVTDIAGPLGELEKSLGGFTTQAQTAAGGVRRPGFADLGPVFSSVLNKSPRSSASNVGATSGFDYNTEGIFSPRRDPVQKVVV